MKDVYRASCEKTTHPEILDKEEFFGFTAGMIYDWSNTLRIPVRLDTPSF